MQGVLDKHVAERMVAECRDEQALHRFQRAAFIAGELLADLGFGQVAKELHRRRVECGDIDRYAKAPLPAMPEAAQEVSEAFQLASEEPAMHGVAELLATRSKKKRRNQEAATS